MNRGLARQKTFLDTGCYSAFLNTLAEAHQRFAIEVHAYCLMGNHYHLILRTPHANLGRAMRHINGVYTQRFDRLRNRDGPLFRGRYKAIVVEAGAYQLSLTRYIHRNPIETGKPLVSNLVDYLWSSYPAYVNSTPSPDWLFWGFTYGALGRRDKYRGYREYVELGVDEELATFYGKQRQAPALGSENFREQLLTGGEVPSAEVARGELISRPAVHPRDVVNTVACVFGCDPARITARSAPGRKGHNPARSVAKWLCQEYTDMIQPEIGRLFGGIHYRAVSQAVRRGKGRFAEDDGLRLQFDSVLNKLGKPEVEP